MRYPKVFTALALAMTFVAHSAVSNAQMKESLSSSTAEDQQQTVSIGEAPKVQLAILLDTSLSMKGLANQAQFQVWNVVSELAQATRDGQPVQLEIALYDYGNIWNSESDGYVGQVIPFTSDLDQVSRALFSVQIDRGRCGKEFCGTAIAKSVKELDWDPSPSTYRSIVIAGNEPFDQGQITFAESLPTLQSLQVPVNTIYCLDPNYDDSLTGADQWRLASFLSDGRYSEINHNHHLPDVMTPMDAELRNLNQRMNETFMWYGNGAEHAMRNQIEQDRNADELSDHAFAARMSAKIGHLYQHIEHDLVDLHQHGQMDLSKMPRSDMPESLKDMSDEEIMQLINTMAQQRERVRREMANTLAERHRFLHRKMSEELGAEFTETPMWGDALIEAIQQQAIDRGFRFGEEEAALE